MNESRVMLKITVRLILIICFSLLIGCVGRSSQLPAPVTSYDGLLFKYIVRPGDTLFSIAWGLNLDYLALAGWNKLDKPYLLKPGQILNLQSVSETVSHHSKSKSGKVGAISRKIIPDFLDWRDKSWDIPAPGGTMHWLWPAVGEVKKDRSGIEIKGLAGQSIRAVELGQVVYSGDGLKGYGKLLIVKHRQGYLSAYGFNRKILVREGDVVKRGARIAEMGEGKNGSALYFEIRKQTIPQNPLSLLPKRPNM